MVLRYRNKCLEKAGFSMLLFAIYKALTERYWHCLAAFITKCRYCYQVGTNIQLTLNCHTPLHCSLYLTSSGYFFKNYTFSYVLQCTESAYKTINKLRTRYFSSSTCFQRRWNSDHCYKIRQKMRWPACTYPYTGQVHQLHIFAQHWAHACHLICIPI